jgi:outer membrane biosynthesis protein TonB
MTNKTIVLAAILALVAGGMSMFVFEGNPVAYAAPRIQETESSRPTPTNEPQATEPPVQPTEPPVQPTEPPVQPTEPPVQPTEKPKPTSKPKKPSRYPQPPSLPPLPFRMRYLVRGSGA